MARKKHNTHHEEHMDESWLIPYADILTLLLALFIVLFSSAQLDLKKFDQIRASFGSAFGSGGGNSVMTGYSGVTGGSPLPPSQQFAPVLPTDTKEQLYMRETVQLLEVKKAMDEYIQENDLRQELRTALTDEGLVVRIKDTALFPSGSAHLLPESERLGREVAKLLLTVPQRVTVAGHTDNVPINTVDFPSNWELSSKRALNFMRFILVSQPELIPERFNATGYGEFRPVSSNNSVEGRAKNRRVEVWVLRHYRQ